MGSKIVCFLTFLRIIPFLFLRRKICMYIWIDMRVSKWFYFGGIVPLRGSWSELHSLFLWRAWKCFLLPKVPFLVFLEFALEQTRHFLTGSPEKADWKRGRARTAYYYTWGHFMGMFNSMDCCFNSYRLHNIKRCFNQLHWSCIDSVQACHVGCFQLESVGWLGILHQ